jgi:hypothetical protein
MNQWKKFGLIILLTKIIFGTRTNIKKVNQKKSLKEAFFCLNYKNYTNRNKKHIMSFINSIIKSLLGINPKKMSKFTTVLNKIKTFETPLHYRMASIFFWQNRLLLLKTPYIPLVKRAYSFLQHTLCLAATVLCKTKPCKLATPPAAAALATCLRGTLARTRRHCSLLDWHKSRLVAPHTFAVAAAAFSML